MCGFIFVYIPIQFTFKLDSFFYRIRHIKGLIQEGVTGICINVFRGVALLIISFTVFNQVSITEERKKNISFTAPYMANHQIIIVGNASPVKAKADLAGKVVGA